MVRPAVEPGRLRPHAEPGRSEERMRRLRLGLLLAATAVAATMSLSAPPAFATGHNEGRGATVEEFVCFRSDGDETRIGTGKVVTTPSGKVQVVCTGKPLEPRPVPE